MESTFGHPRYVFPPKEETLAAIRRFVDDALSDGVDPGAARLRAREGAGDPEVPLRPRLRRAAPTRSVHAVNRVYEAHGVGAPERAGARAGGAGARRGGGLRRRTSRAARRCAASRRRRTAILTGWAIDGEPLLPRRGRRLPALRPRRLPVARALRQGDRRRRGCSPCTATRTRSPRRSGRRASGPSRCARPCSWS